MSGVEDNKSQAIRKMCRDMDIDQLREFAIECVTGSAADRIAEETIVEKTPQVSTDSPSELCRKLSVQQARVSTQIKKAETTRDSKVAAVETAKKALVTSEVDRDSALAKLEELRTQQAEVAQNLAKATKEQSETRAKDAALLEQQQASSALQVASASQSPATEIADFKKAVHKITAAAAKKAKSNGAPKKDKDGKDIMEVDGADAEKRAELQVVSEKASDQLKQVEDLLRQFNEAKEGLAKSIQEGDDVQSL